MIYFSLALLSSFGLLWLLETIWFLRYEGGDKMKIYFWKLLAGLWIYSWGMWGIIVANRE